MVFVPQVVSDRSEFSRPGNLCLQLARQDWSCDGYILNVFDVFYDFLRFSTSSHLDWLGGKQMASSKPHSAYRL